MSCGISLRPGLDQALLWLWCCVAGGYSSDSTPSLGTSYAAGAALNRQKQKPWSSCCGAVD